MKLLPDLLTPGEDRAFFMIQGRGLRWGMSTAHIARVATEEEAGAPPPLPLPEDFLPFDDGLVGRWLLIVDTPHGPRSLSVSRFLELVPSEQLNLQPLPPLCIDQSSAAAFSPTQITQVAIASTSDDLLFLVVAPRRLPA